MRPYGTESGALAVYSEGATTRPRRGARSVAARRGRQKEVRHSHSRARNIGRDVLLEELESYRCDCEADRAEQELIDSVLLEEARMYEEAYYAEFFEMESRPCMTDAEIEADIWDSMLESEWALFGDCF